MPQAKIGVIGGTGLYDIEGLTDTEEVDINAPFGKPSDTIIIGKLEGVGVAFLPRHGRGHRISPTEIPARANIYALKKLGVTHIIASGAVGSLTEQLRSPARKQKISSNGTPMETLHDSRTPDVISRSSEHLAHLASDRCLGNREMLQGYFAAVTAMDIGLGRILDRIEALGLRDDTLVVFVSDNGFSCGHHGFWGKGNGTNPRNMYENSIKVPFVLSHPRVIPQGRVEEGMVSAYDFLPALLDYLGLPIPETQNLPGRSVVEQPVDVS